MVVYNNNNDRLAGISAALNTIIGHKHQRDSIHVAVDFLIPPTSPKQQRDRRGCRCCCCCCLLLFFAFPTDKWRMRQMGWGSKTSIKWRHPSKNRKPKRANDWNLQWWLPPIAIHGHGSFGFRIFIKMTSSFACGVAQTAGLFPSI